MTRTVSAAALASMLAASLATPVRAQSSALPETYSYLAANSIMGSDMTVKVNRNGARELIERTIAKPGEPAAFHDRVLYDFQAHRLYTLDLTSNICTTQQYASAYAPLMIDTVGGSAEFLKEFASHPPPVLRSENVNGISTRVVEVALPEGQGKYKLWLDQKFNFIVKWAVALGSEPERTQVEIKQLSYAPSSAALFTPPPGCRPVGGVVDANGGHAEMTAEVTVQAETKQLGEPEAPAATPPPQGGAGTAAKVTAVRLRLVPESYTGTCPARLQLVGEISTDGPGTVWYSFLAGAVAVSGSREGTMSVPAAGTHTITLEATVRSTPRVPHLSMLAIMEDQEGRRGPQNVTSGPVDYNITCTGQAAPVKR